MKAIGTIAWWGLIAAGVVGVPGLPHGGEALPRGRRASEVKSEHWFNSAPLARADLRGKIQLVEFWTFRCINCVRTVPAMRNLSERFPAGDVVVIGVHTPELDEERDPRRVGEALRRLGVRFPVAMDNDHAVWRAFGNRYWPALYLVDKRGVIRHTHIGELHEGTLEWRVLLERIDALRREPA